MVNQAMQIILISARAKIHRDILIDMHSSLCHHTPHKHLRPMSLQHPAEARKRRVHVPSLHTRQPPKVLHLCHPRMERWVPGQRQNRPKHQQQLRLLQDVFLACGSRDVLQHTPLLPLLVSCAAQLLLLLLHLTTAAGEAYRRG